MSSDTYTYDLEVDIPPVFELDAEYPDGGVSFNELLPDSPPQMKEVVVSVKTNIGKPYEVIQNVSTTLTNESGKMIDREYFTVRAELVAGEAGRIQPEDFTPVQEGDTILFVSDKSGSPSRFKVGYRLRPYRQMPPGEYKTGVVYSLNEI